MIKSPAFKVLSGNAVKVFILGKDRWGGQPENRFQLPYTKTGLSPKASSRCFSELTAFGFLDVTERGGLYHKANIYTWSERWKSITAEDVKRILAESKSGKIKSGIPGNYNGLSKVKLLERRKWPV
ncbi:hypothetical protein KKA53_05370 [Candidatus Dependentiae bacterium]|nr:hypothetical protein [Candidatus Dependentiae bacterium]